MFKRILLPVDPARPFEGANEYAVALAHRFESKLVAAYVIDEHLLGHIGGEAAATLDDALEWVARDAIDDFAEHHQDLDVQKAIAYGPTATALFQMVLQTGTDVVVVGGYHSGAAPHLWGSTVADVVHHVERPTFVIRKGGRLPQAGDRIVVPFDASDRALNNLPRILRFAKDMGAGIELVYVCKAGDAKSGDAILQTGLTVAQDSGVEATTVLLRRSMFKAKWRIILEHSRRAHSPLIALSRLGRSSSTTGRSKTVAHLVAHAEIPVWVVRK